MNFQIENNGIVSEKFRTLNIYNFESACKFISELPYKRNQNKDNITCIFDDNGGTCSTKHAALRKLALENSQTGVALILGIFNMDAAYSSLIKGTLENYKLASIPEAHMYLKIGNEYYDFTRPNASYKDFENKIFIEKTIEYNQVNVYKISIHRAFLENWIIENDIKYSLEELWNIREKCIEDLQS